MKVEGRNFCPAHGEENTLALLLISPSPGTERGKVASERITAFQKSHEKYLLSIRLLNQIG